MANRSSDLRSSRATVFHPKPEAAAENLKKATIFTRIFVLATPQTVTDALSGSPGLSNTFLFAHFNNILVFDTVADEHTTHVRAVLQMLRDANMKADINYCAFDKTSWTEAGFHIEAVGANKMAFMVVLREDLAPDAIATIDRQL